MLDWWPDWEGQDLVIVASGPSAKDVPLELARGKARVIVINSSWKLAPWADMLFACDLKWWTVTNGCPEFQGMKVTIDRAASVRFGLNYVKCMKGDDRMLIEKGVVGWGGNSGFHCLNLALQFKVKRVLMVGYDMRTDKGLHWHGAHPNGLHNPRPGNVERWRRAVDAAHAVLAKNGIEAINCSRVSRLTEFPKMDFAEAMR